MSKKSLGLYLLDQLHQRGIEHIFGIPGDYVLKFDRLIEQHSKIQFINATRENTAGYMADAYARFKGLGVACITYGVGINIVNAISQAYVEDSPLVIISGAPGHLELTKEVRLHHLFNKSLQLHLETTQMEIFKHITVAQTVLDNSENCKAEIERVLSACMTLKKPVYIEIPRDQVEREISGAMHKVLTPPAHDPLALKEALEEITHLLKRSKHPILWVGHEIMRHKLSHEILSFARKFSIPIVSSLLGKTTIDEWDPLFVGVYLGGMSSPKIQHYVESCDCILRIGVLLNDLDTGVFTAKFNQKNQIIATSDECKINHHYYENVPLTELVKGLTHINLQKKFPLDLPTKEKQDVFKPQSMQIDVDRFFKCVQSHLKADHVLISDIGDCLFGSSELVLHANSYLSCAHFASLGFAVPAAIGVQLACPNKRPIVLVGDGAFQMTCMELSTAVRYGLDPVVIVMNNRGYGTERPIVEGKFNDILNWNYAKIPEVLGGGKGVYVRTEEDLQHALKKAIAARGEFQIIEVELQKNDLSAVLKRFGTLMNGI